MGLSCKLVSSDGGIDWSPTPLQAQVLDPPKPPPLLSRRQLQPQPQPEPLKCPRCDSTNTKFCYYNNYNKSQPRHFCKTCKRHWTKGGTLRNVPVGGGRKNKRIKTCKTGAAVAATTAATTCKNNNGDDVINNKMNTQMAVQAHQQQNFGHVVGDHKRVCESLFQALSGPPNSSVFQQNNGVFLGPSTFSHALQFPCPNSTTCNSQLCAIPTSFQSSNFYGYNGDQAMEDSTITTIMPPTTRSVSQLPWQFSNASSGTMDMQSYNWDWDDIDTLVSTNDLNITWDES